jgi:hypothetical protein
MKHILYKGLNSAREKIPQLASFHFSVPEDTPHQVLELEETVTRGVKFPLFVRMGTLLGGWGAGQG